MKAFLKLYPIEIRLRRIMSFVLTSHLTKITAEFMKEIWCMSYVYIVQIYAVGSSSNHGMYVLDFHPHTSSACHVDYKWVDLSSLFSWFSHNQLTWQSNLLGVCWEHMWRSSTVSAIHWLVFFISSRFFWKGRLEINSWYSMFQRGNKRLRRKQTCRKQVYSFIWKGAFVCSPSTQS
jgi:hypothetical protein